jgi:gamma-glutamylcyclotransferase (GGCT)/AIG2-like uncharacterized protein YtfP
MSESFSIRCLFVYGTLREAAGHELHKVLETNAMSLGQGTVRGELYDLGGYPGLVHDRDATGVVKGEAYEIDADRLAPTLRVLDEYEGLSVGDRSSREYRRALVPVTLDDGRPVDAWAYVVCRSLEGLTRIWSGDFVTWRASRRGALLPNAR